MDDLTHKQIAKFRVTCEALEFAGGTTIFLKRGIERLVAAVVSYEDRLELARPPGPMSLGDKPSRRNYWHIRKGKELHVGQLVILHEVATFIHLRTRRPDKESAHRRHMATLRPKYPNDPKVRELLARVKAVPVYTADGKVGWYIPFWRELHPLEDQLDVLWE